MKKHLQIFLAGVIMVAPFAITVYVIWWAGSGLENLARSGIAAIAPGAEENLFTGAGTIMALVGIYLIGLLTRWWVFRVAVGLLEWLLHRLPLVKTIYEALRDVIRLFGGDANRLGQVVRYRIPGTEIDLLGIRTSTTTRFGGQNKVAVYLPLSYQFAGYTIFVPADAVEPVDMSVEEALKIAATASVMGNPQTPAGAPPGAADPKK